MRAPNPLPLKALLAQALMGSAMANRGVSTFAQRDVLANAPQLDRVLHLQESQPHRPLEHADEAPTMPRRRSRNGSHTNEPGHLSSAPVSIEGMSVADAYVLMKMRQLHPAQYAHNPGARHRRELGALSALQPAS